MSNFASLLCELSNDFAAFIKINLTNGALFRDNVFNLKYVVGLYLLNNLEITKKIDVYENICCDEFSQIDVLSKIKNNKIANFYVELETYQLCCNNDNCEYESRHSTHYVKYINIVYKIGNIICCKTLLIISSLLYGGKLTSQNVHFDCDFNIIESEQEYITHRRADHYARVCYQCVVIKN